MASIDCICRPSLVFKKSKRVWILPHGCLKRAISLLRNNLASTSLKFTRNLLFISKFKSQQSPYSLYHPIPMLGLDQRILHVVNVLYIFLKYLDLLLLKKAHILLTCILLIYDRRNRALVKELSVPEQGTKDLYFPTQYSQPFFEQLKACLWKQWWTYWRSPDYNCVRYSFTFISAILFGTIFWNLGHKTYARLPFFLINYTKHV